MNAKDLHWLKSHNACGDAVEWCKQFETLAEAWNKCPRSDWMLWVINLKKCGDKKTLRLFACWCVRQRQVWHLLTDERGKNAVRVAERFARGEATREELDAAWAAARAAWDVALKKQADKLIKMIENPF